MKIVSNIYYGNYYNNFSMQKPIAPNFKAKQKFVKALSDETLKIMSAAAASVGIAALAMAQKKNTKVPNGTIEAPIIYDIKNTDKFDYKGQIVTKPSQLSLFHMNDFHGQSIRMERAYSANQAFQSGKLQKANIFDDSLPVDKLRLCSGDMFLGDNPRRIAMVNEFLNSIGVIASAVGNHECDSSVSDFADIVNGKNYRLLSANIHPHEENVINDVISDSFIVEINGNKYGIIGVSPIDFMKHTSRPDEISTFNLDDFDSTIKEIQSDIGTIKQAGVNKIILLSHLGVEYDKLIAQCVNDLDVILGGHTHTLFNDVKEGENLFYSPKGEPVLIVQSGKDGEYIGVPNLKFNEFGQLTDIDYRVIRTDDYRRSDEMRSSFEKYFDDAKPLGVIKSVESDCESIYTGENPHASFMLDCLRAELDTDLAVMNAAAMRNEFFEGQVKSYDLENISPFTDNIIVIQVSEKELVKAIEGKVKETILSPTSRPGILQISGMKYKFNNKSGELISLSIVDKLGNEKAIDINNPSEKLYTVAVNSFCASDEYSGMGLKHRCDNAIKDFDCDIKKFVSDWLLKQDDSIVIKNDGRIQSV